MIYPLALDFAADGVPVTVTCRVLGFSTQAFCKWKKKPVIQRDWDDAHLIDIAREIHADDPAFGYRFIAHELPERGITACENRVARLCSQERLWSVFSNKRGRKFVHDCHATTYKDQWDGSGHETLLQWSRFSPYCRRTFSIDNAGRPANSYGWQ